MISNFKKTFGAAVVLLASASSVCLAQPSIFVGSGSGDPGDLVEIPVEFDTDGTVVEVSFEILYDNLAFPDVDLDSECDGNEVGPNLVNCEELGPGLVRIQILSPTEVPLVSGQMGVIGFLSDVSALGDFDLIIDIETISMTDILGIEIPPDLLIDGLIVISGMNVSVLNVEPPSIDFGAHPEGSSPPTELVTISNDGDPASELFVTFATLDLADNFVILSGGTCPDGPFSLLGGDSCTLEIAFLPIGSGVLGDILVVVADADIEINSEVSLTGEVLTGDAELLVTPGSLDFGEVLVDGPGICQPVSATNIGTVDGLGIVDVVVGGAPFTIQANACIDAVLLPTDSCNFSICFEPDSAGTFSDALTVSSTVNNQVVPLEGVGVAAVSDATLLMVNSAIDFGPVGIDEPAACATNTLFNAGSTGVLQVLAVVLDADAAFSIQAETCIGSILSPSDFCSVTVCFDPEEVGDFAGQLFVDSDINNESASLSGQGVPTLADAALAVSPGSFDFGAPEAADLPLCTVFSYSNVGASGALTVQSLALTDAEAFEIASTDCSGVTLQPGNSCTAEVCFAPTALGAFSDALVAISSVDDQDPVVAELFGELAEALGPGLLSIAPASFDFGPQFVGVGADPALFTLANLAEPGALAVTLDAFGLSNDGPFELNPGSCSSGTVLQPGGDGCTIELRFVPQESGPVAGSVIVTATDGQVVEAEVAGQGELVDFSTLQDQIVFRAEHGGDHLGSALVAVGDFNADGVKDLAMGAPGAGPEGEGVVYLIFDILLGLGSFADVPSLLTDVGAGDGQAGVRILGEEGLVSGCPGSGSHEIGFGFDVAAIDGFFGGVEDMGHNASVVAVGAPGWGGSGEVVSTYGAVYLLSSQHEIDQGTISVSQWLETGVEEVPTGLRLLQSDPDAGCIGRGVTMVGDLDGDGFADLAVIGSPIASELNPLHANVWVVYGGDQLLSAGDIDLSLAEAGVSRIRVPFEQARDSGVGPAIAPAGDFNGNGFNDFVVTAPNAVFIDQTTGRRHAGAAFVMIGSGEPLPAEIFIPIEIGPEAFATEVVVILGPEVPANDEDGEIGQEYPFFGISVDHAGRFSGSEYSDLVIGSGSTPLVEGAAYVIFGGPGSGPIAVDELNQSSGLGIFSLQETDRQFGDQVKGVGDVRGSGADSILIAAPGAIVAGSDGELAPGAGKVYVISGALPMAGSANLKAAAGLASVPEGLDVTAISPEGFLPAQLLENARFGSNLTGFGADVTGSQGSDMAVSAPGGLAADGEAGGGWVFVIPGMSRQTALSLDVAAFADDLGLPGRSIEVTVQNAGEFPATELVLSFELESELQSVDAAVSLIGDCQIAGDDVRCASAAEPRWRCTASGSAATCTMSSLQAATASRVLLQVQGDGPVPLEASVAAFNAATIVANEVVFDD